MNFNDIQKVADGLYYPVSLLEDVISHKARKKVRAWLKGITILLFLISTLLYLAGRFSSVYGPFSLASKVYGIFYLSLFVWILFFILEAFYYSYYYNQQSSGGVFIDFDLAHIIHKISLKSEQRNIIKTFFATEIGSLILLRCGVNAEAFGKFLSEGKTSSPITDFKCEIIAGQITLASFANALLNYDKSLAEFLFSFGIQKKELTGVTEWIAEAYGARKTREHWWSKNNLERIPGLGQDWSYGRAYLLEEYKRVLLQALSAYSIHSTYGESELKELETILSRRREGNVFLIGNDQTGKLDIISRLSSMIEEGKVVRELKRKRIVLLDNDLFISKNETKAEFESEFITMMKEAISAGNIILVIEDMPSFMTSSAGLGADVVSLLEPYLSSPHLQVVGLSDSYRFHELIEKNASLMQNFETILIKEVDEFNTLKVLQNDLIKFENEGFFFTYPALLAIVDSAERYFPGGVMPDKATDLLSEIVSKQQASGKGLIEKNDVLSLVEIKTGIPVGNVKAEEKDKLIHLEEILHRRIVGQDEAIKAVSSAVRRARSGITNPNRPLGSFLFLGPTGVGKTETTKALAEVFFGSDVNVMRLDMSEYSSFDATSKLIGSFESKQEGVLSSMLREHQYGVLLLDEFEKTTKEVMNLFLQILDEGFFSDMSGKKVGARNLIIIATSNAGSGEIWEAIKSGNDLSKSKEAIVDSIVKQGIFKPELLNRFDGVIVFHPLTDIDLREISQLMLQKLHGRLAERGMNLVVNDALINFVVSHGTDPKFGARPMNRAIQEKVEQLVADKIISGDIKPGSEIVLRAEDFNGGN